MTIEETIKGINEKIAQINALDTLSDAARNRLDLKAYLRMLRQKSPFHVEFLQKLNSGGSSLVLANKTLSHHIKPLNQAAKGFQMAGLAFAAMEFFEIPAMYLEAWLWGETVPFTLRNNTRWAYTAVILALMIVSFAMPAIALPIWATLSCLALGETVVTLGDLWKRSRELPVEIEALKKEIQERMLGFDNLPSVSQLIVDLNQMTKNQGNEQSAQIQISAKAVQLEARLIGLHELKLELLQKQAELDRISPKTVIDKGMRVVFASLSLVGMVLFVFAPPVGGIFLAAVAGLVLSYAVGRLVQDSVWPVIASYMETKRLENTFEEVDEEEEDIAQTAELFFVDPIVQSSTARMSVTMGGQYEQPKQPDHSEAASRSLNRDLKPDVSKEPEKQAPSISFNR